MSDQPAGVRPDTAFWIIGLVALLWYLFGLYVYYTGVTATPDELAAMMTPAQVAVFAATPAWVTSANATAVTAGVIACILMLMRNSLAVPFFALSLIAAVVQDIYVFFLSDSLEAFGMQPVVIQGFVLVIGVFMLVYTRKKKAQGVLT